MNHSHHKIKRLAHVDLLRLLAIYLVIFNHTGNQGYLLFADKMESPLSLVYMMASVFCKIAVPIFFMISGALLLKKEESLKQLFLKRVFRIAIVLVLVSIPYYYWLRRSNGVSITSFLTWIYAESASTSLWYLYSYIALLLVLPFLRSMVKNMQQKDFVYLAIGYLVFVGVLPCLEYLLWNGTVTLHESFAPVLFMTQNVFFALMGYYFEYVFDGGDHERRNIGLGILFSVIAILLTCFMTYHQAWTEGVGTTQQMERFFNCFICVPAMTTYFLVKRQGEKIQGQRIRQLLSVLGSSVFGVYLIEKLIRVISGRLHTLLLPFVGSFIASLIWCLAVLCLGLLIVVPLKRIPGIKRVVNKFI